MHFRMMAASRRLPSAFLIRGPWHARILPQASQIHGSGNEKQCPLGLHSQMVEATILPPPPTSCRRKEFR